MRNLEDKQKILERHLRLNEPVSLKRSDIVPIFNYSWMQLFTRKDENLKAMVGMVTSQQGATTRS